MAKYTIIIPVYNSGKYLKKCLDSIINQTFKNYNVIIINDGSTDNSEDIIDEYAKNYNFIKKLNKQNGGVSSARNAGLDEVNGEYFLFVDSDDYVANNLLEVIDKNIENRIDVLSYNMQTMSESENIIDRIMKPSFDIINGQDAIIEFINKCNLFDTPVGYVYNTEYFKSNSFLYAEGKEHEDFGLTPLVLICAKSVKSINDSLYYYLQTENSITRTADYKKTIKKAYDMLYHFDYLYNAVNSNSNINSKTKKVFNSFLANSLILKSKTLQKRERKTYVEELKQRKILDLLLTNSVPRLIKKVILRIRM